MAVKQVVEGGDAGAIGVDRLARLGQLLRVAEQEVDGDGSAS